MARIRVLIVEDSLTVREYFAGLLAGDPELEIIGTAGDGKEAIDQCIALRPDIITLDMALPTMSGLAVTEYVMAYCPTPILIVSSSTNRGDLFKTYDALAAGAIDVLEKPPAYRAEDDWERTFIATVKLVSRIKTIMHPRLKLGTQRAASGRGTAGSPARHEGSGAVELIAIGASTGGPGAVLELLRGLPARFPLPILLVMHVGELFATAFAEWLDSNSPLRVRYATDGEPVPQPGQAIVLVAPPGKHLLVEGSRLVLSDAAERNFCRPSIDILFESLAAEPGRRVAACLMTGMGRDGASGLLALRKAGALTMAQDEASCVIYGMPREAVLLNAAEKILPLGDFAPELISIANCRGMS